MEQTSKRITHIRNMTFRTLKGLHTNVIGSTVIWVPTLDTKVAVEADLGRSQLQQMTSP